MVPIVYPVLHALIFSYLFIIYIITHAWTSPGKYSRDRERSFFLDITPPHQCSLSHTRVATHARTQKEKDHTHTRRERKPSSRDRRSSGREIGSTIIARLYSLIRLLPMRKWREQRARHCRPCILGSTHRTLSRRTYIYKITHAAIAHALRVNVSGVDVCALSD